MPDRLEDVAEQDGRFDLKAYVLVFEALGRAQRIYGRAHHVSGHELLEGLRALAIERYGRMAKTVLNSWGVGSTDDIGAIVFNLVGSGLMSKTDEDRVEDFHAVFDFDETFVERYDIPPPGTDGA